MRELNTWLLLGTLSLFVIIAVFVGLALRDGYRWTKKTHEYAQERDEQGRKILPPNAPNMSIGSLQAQVNEVSIKLEELWTLVTSLNRDFGEHLQLHKEWEQTEEDILRLTPPVMEALGRFANEPKQPDNQ